MLNVEWWVLNVECRVLNVEFLPTDSMALA